MNKYPNILKRYPIRIIPITTIKINAPNNLGFTAFLNIISEGKDKAVTLIINERIVPRPAPFPYSASAIGSVPKISAYIGVPSTVATNGEYHESDPKTISIQFSGITLCIMHPIPTPITI